MYGHFDSGMFSESKWHQRPQVVWKHILQQEPDLWIWLGDGTNFISYFTVVIENLSACSILVTLHGQLNQSVGEV